MDYVRDVPRDDPEALAGEEAHVRAYLSAAVDADDDPNTNADDVRIEVRGHPEDPDMFRIHGWIDGEPVAPYLEPGHDPYEGVSEQLMADAGLIGG